MTAAGRTLRMDELCQSLPPWPFKASDTELLIRWPDESRALIDRAEYVGGVLLLSVQAEPAQSKLNELVVKIEDLLESNLTKKRMTEVLTELFNEYEVETT